MKRTDYIAPQMSIVYYNDPVRLNDLSDGVTLPDVPLGQNWLDDRE